MKAAVVAFRKYRCHNVGTLLLTHGSIGLGEGVTGPERSGHGQPPHWAPGSRGEMSRTRLWRPWRHSGGSHQIIIWCSHCPVSGICISWGMIERGVIITGVLVTTTLSTLPCVGVLIKESQMLHVISPHACHLVQACQHVMMSYHHVMSCHSSLTSSPSCHVSCVVLCRRLVR